MKTSCHGDCGRCAGLSRRTFIGGVLGLLAALTLAPRRALAKKLAVGLSKVPQLRQEGGSVSLRIKGRYVLLLRDGPTTVRALSARCTHKKTALKYDAKRKRIQCPEHGSIFSVEGKVLKGPAKVDLPRYWSKLDLPKDRLLLKL